jgi:hypothetical protein
MRKVTNAVLLMHSGILFSHKNKCILSFERACIKLKIIILNEIIQAQKSQAPHNLIHIFISKKLRGEWCLPEARESREQGEKGTELLTNIQGIVSSKAFGWVCYCMVGLL